jgi:glucose/mannose-6-phosphate isomerase
MPRAAFGLLCLAPLGALDALGLVSGLEPEVVEAARVLEGTLAACAPGVPLDANPAKTLAARAGRRAAVIWGAQGVASVAASRWKTQWNENAKLPAFASALPELDHNEVVGWTRDSGRGFHLFVLRHEGEHPDVAARVPISVEIARRAGMEVDEVWTRAVSPLARLMELVAIGDLASTYSALSRGVDPTPIEAITRLKAALAGADA